MAIQWQHNLDDGLRAAKNLRRPVLLDFTAAPM
jgi:hypothetical protein